MYLTGSRLFKVHAILEPTSSVMEGGSRADASIIESSRGIYKLRLFVPGGTRGMHVVRVQVGQGYEDFMSEQVAGSPFVANYEKDMDEERERLSMAPRGNQTLTLTLTIIGGLEWRR